jgi:hypothetical protein
MDEIWPSSRSSAVSDFRTSFSWPLVNWMATSTDPVTDPWCSKNPTPLL